MTPDCDENCRSRLHTMFGVQRQAKRAAALHIFLTDSFDRTNDVALALELS